MNNSRRRITYIHQHFRGPNDGGGTRSWEFARRLARDGHSVTILCGGPQNESRDIAGVAVIQLRSPYANDMSKTQRIIAFVSFMVTASVAALRVPADVVIGSSTPLTVVVPAMVVATIKRIPFIFEVRDLWPSVPVRLGYLSSPMLITVAQHLESLAYRKASKVIALSPGMREGVLQTTPKAQVVVIPNACDFELFDKTNEQRNAKREQLGWSRPTVLYAGSFGNIYNMSWPVSLAAACPTIEFQLIGDGSTRNEALSLARELGLDAQKLMPGMLPKTEVSSRVSAADIGMSSVQNHPALHAASINKVFDCLASGRPVLFNHDGWLSELVVSKGAGWRLPDDVVDAAKELERIVSTPEEVERAGANAANLAKQFDREALYQVFQETVCAPQTAATRNT